MHEVAERRAGAPALAGGRGVHVHYVGAIPEWQVLLQNLPLYRVERASPPQGVAFHEEDNVRLREGLVVLAARQRVRIQVAGVQAGPSGSRATWVALDLDVIQAALAVRRVHVELHRAAGQARQRV